MFVELQARVRGNFARQVLERRQNVVSKRTDDFVKIQAQARGFLIRHQIQHRKKSLQDVLPIIISLQSLARTHLVLQPELEVARRGASGEQRIELHLQ